MKQNATYSQIVLSAPAKRAVRECRFAMQTLRARTDGDEDAQPGAAAGHADHVLHEAGQDEQHVQQDGLLAVEAHKAAELLVVHDPEI